LRTCIVTAFASSFESLPGVTGVVWVAVFIFSSVNFVAFFCSDPRRGTRAISIRSLE
jgi:hypothetical protein